ncbi:signal recognition particle [Achromatium sp. WMS2]|nr:signal recognition particle [Achromatium sp. WMS2]
MFANLQQRLTKVLGNLRGQGRLTESNIKDTLREVRMALLEADVALPVVRDFIEEIKNKATGEEVLRSLSPGQTLIKIVYDELVRVMGVANEQLNLTTQPPAVVLMAGLQGSGKTTSVAKLARWLIEKQKKTVMVVSCDVYRPAAIAQLQTLALEVNAKFFPSQSSEQPVTIATQALKAAKLQFVDVLLVDTAGRLHIDTTMMTEIQSIHKVLNPIETLFVVDSMTGQDAAKTASAFHAALPLTGVILTKTDGDARGGAALSIRKLTDKPIKFLGTSERTTGLEPFHPDRVASRILGMGDVLTLVEEVQTKLDQEKAAALTKKLYKGKGFDLADFKTHLEEIGRMGGMGSLMDKMPGMSGLPEHIKNQASDAISKQLLAMINSMTLKERAFPDLIKGSRKRRIAAGSGTQVQDVNRLLRQFEQTQKIMKKFKGGNIRNLLRGIKSRIQ